ncbi:MAG: anaerobic ribonucleoside-triphosphate reductase activating protein [Cyanobacteriota bacterium]|nr:anaerobic ribonucleoside-triphosphate reductase activating protein [Cyanobacteriota bacterium]MDY6358857.1 anaerobic ribonucleoside-triphosphate reductase activating protein [Cyanobacteriota bacterium]MDY6364858.1 anaerobic ribonucleoside-triphosphate reductase activating protein [Cyanobacteriota bacterium]MDY6382283.1 anaerobic ribonucleoside-triphosphate reductase activating protein [Cyanobacteriota bacterium]
MNYHDITKQDMLNGDGLRVVLWVSGCNHHCKNCQNPITWDKNGGLPFDEAAEKELFEALDKPFIDGITFSGGDPLFPDNRSEVFRLIKKIRKLLPDKTIWLYTGYTWEQIKDLEDIKDIDVICEGEFVEKLKDNNKHWVGSTNQRVINVPETLKTGKVVLHE